MREIPDLNHWKRRVDFEAVAAAVRAAGGDRVILKASEGAYFGDPFFAHYVKGFRAVGLGIDVFHYWRWFVDPRMQAETFAIVLDGVSWTGDDGDAWIDCEDPRARAGLGTSIQIQTMIAEFYTWTEIVAGIYTRAEYWDRIIPRGSNWQDFKLWVAHHGALRPRIPRDWSSWDLWQYTERGRLPGVKGNVDLNRIQEPGSTEPAAGHVVVLVHALNVREGPGIDFRPVDAVLRGQVLEFYERSANWLRIAPEGGARWVSDRYYGGATVRAIE